MPTAWLVDPPNSAKLIIIYRFIQHLYFVTARFNGLQQDIKHHK